MKSRIAALLSVLLASLNVSAAGYGDLSACLDWHHGACTSLSPYCSPGGSVWKSWQASSYFGETAWEIVIGYDCQCNNVSNFAGFCSTGAVSTSSSPPPQNNTDGPSCPATTHGSNVDVEAQTVTEYLPLVGLDFSLAYSSAWAESRTIDYEVNVPVTGSTPESGIADYDIEAKIESTTIDTSTITNSADQTYSHTWNGLISSQAVLGSVFLHIWVTPDGTGFPVFYARPVGTVKAHLLGFGGWLPTNYHFYDRHRKRLYKGDGSIQPVNAIELSGGNFLVPEVDGSKVYEFSPQGRHLYTKSGLLGTTLATFNYTTYGGVPLLTSIAEPFSRTTNFSRNGSGVLSSITSPDGVVTTVTITNGLLTAVANPLSETYSMTYVTNKDLLATFEKPEGHASTFTYDSKGRLTDDDHSGGYEFTLSKSYSSPTAHTSTHTTSMGRVKTSTVSADSLNGNSGNYSRSLALPSGVTHTFAQTGLSTFTSFTNGITYTRNFTDDFRFGGRVRVPYSSSYDYKRSTTFTESGALSDASDPFSYSTITYTSTMNSQNTTTVFDKTAKTFSSTTPEGRVGTIGLDVYERVVSRSWATDTPIAYTYTNDKLTAVTQGARSTTLSFNGSGLIESITNDLSQTTAYAYDAAHRLRYVTLPDTRVVEYGYDDNGNLISVTPPGKSAHGFMINGHELMGEYQPPAISPLTVNTQYDYNDDRQLIEITRPDSQSIDLNYGSTTGVLSSVVTPDGTYNYGFNTYHERFDNVDTPAGIQNYIVYSTGHVSYEYFRESWNLIGTYNTSYNSLDQLESDTVTPTSGSAISASYTYDNDELITGAGDLTIDRHSATGRIEGTSVGLVEDEWTYNSFGELTGYLLKFNSTNVYGYTITRDDLGRVSAKSETVQGTTTTFDYTYDSAGRLNDVDRNSASYSNYTFDSNSNRTSGAIGGTSFTGAYDAHDRLTDWNVYDYTYNNNGELATKTNTMTSEVWTYVYDVLGHLKSVTLPSSDVISYEADAFGRRAFRKLNGSISSRYLWAEGRLIGELDSSGAFKGRFVYGTKSHVPDLMVVGSDVYRIVTDHIGSVRMVIKSDDGTVAQKIEYNELGKVLSDTSPGFQPFGFAGGIYDPDTKLVRFGARDYDPAVGRWTSKDPILFRGGDTNLYGYTFNDPINFIDPSGKIGFLPAIGVGAIVGGVAGGIGAYIGGGSVTDGIIGGAFGGAAAVVFAGPAIVTGGVSGLTGAFSGIGGGLVQSAIDGLLNVGGILPDGPTCGGAPGKK